MSTNGIAVASHGSAASGNPIYARVTWRFMPLLFICYAVAYLDRVNVGFAKLQMLNDLHFSEAMYGFGAGISCPTVVGWLKTLTHSLNSSLFLIAACLCVSALLILTRMPAKLVNQ